MTSPATSCRAILATAPGRGAIAIIQLHGDTLRGLRAITGTDSWPVGRLRLSNLAGIDEGLGGRITEHVAQIMPHGGTRVVRLLLEALHDAGVQIVSGDDERPGDLYPEAPDEVSARMLQALAQARSPLAIDVLLDQPRRHRDAARDLEDPEDSEAPGDAGRSRRLQRLIVPPRVVLAGAPNAGKSTLSNALLGRSMSIALDEPGTTRDYTTGMIDLAGIVVQWHDTPGLRDAHDEAERAAIALARRLLGGADFVIALAEPNGDWPALERVADLRVGSKSDVAERDDADLCVSATTGAGLRELTAMVRNRLVTPDDLARGRVMA